MSAPELVAGYVVAGKYAIRSLLLQGGATSSHRAVAPKNREVVVKLYDPAILSFPDVLKALAQHQSIGAKLAGQPIVPIAESGTDPNSGAPFTVTDFQSNPSLAQLIDRGPLSASGMLALVRNLARATDLLHSSGIGGLSLHPGNVFVRPDAQYEVRIADFGATLVRSALPAAEKVGRWMPWLAPEQIKGQTSSALAADIFSLALIAFFAVTGKPYWRSSQGKAIDTAALRREILGERMPASVRASEFSITLNPAVDAVFARALAFRATDRYSTAREFAAGLEAVVAGRPVADIDAARPQPGNVGTATAKADGPAAQRAPSSGDAAPVTQRLAVPPPRKMPQRATMLGMGNQAAEGLRAATTAGPRPPLSTMLGIGETVAEAPAAAPAKATAPAVPTAPAKTAAPATATAPARGAASVKTAAPATATAPAKTAAPATATAPAKAAEPPTVVPLRTTQRGGPPPLPMAPPPAGLEEVLTRFEAGPPDRLPEPASPAPSLAVAAVMQPSPAWPTAEHRDAGGEHVDTGVAVVGADLAVGPRNARLRWVASGCAVLVLTGGAIWALSGGSTDAKAIATARTAATQAPPISAKAPSAMVEPQAANAVQQGTQETRTGASLEPAAPAPSRPAVPEPETAVSEPATAEPAGPAAPRTAPAAPHSPPSQKPCGKFLKRCK